MLLKKGRPPLQPERADDQCLLLREGLPLRQRLGYALEMDILDHPLITTRYFFPQAIPLDNPTWVPTPVGPLACWRSASPGDRPVLVHFHGNGEVVHHWIQDFVPIITAMGYDVFLAEYRGYGGSSGVPVLGGMLDDVEAIADVVGVPPEQIVVFGRSVGSIFAMEWIHRFPTCRGLVVESGIHDVYQRLALRIAPHEMDLAQLKEAIGRRVDHRMKLSGYAGPSLFLHAEGDDLVEIEHATLNAEAAGSKATLVRLPFGDHNSIMYANQQAYFSALQRFLADAAGSERR
jgi:pimeloyl-ACP methyl ester carboxylesterase